MSYTTVFRRYEIKYMITPAQKEILLSEMRERMLPDPLGECCQILRRGWRDLYLASRKAAYCGAFRGEYVCQCK